MLQKLLFSSQPWQKYLVKIIAFILFCAATLGFLLCIAAFMIIRIDTPEYVLIPLTTVMLAFTSFIDSFLLAKIMKENGLVTGLAVGMIFVIMVIALGLYHKTFALTGLFFSKVAAVLLAGAMGGILGVNA
ncbi:MAG: TIGR04086 family membrane protein [Oscillospiraceae bacterium]|nr:TIGR04086 family membrane protein [Oscillospiraceae bacterium]